MARSGLDRGAGRAVEAGVHGLRKGLDAAVPGVRNLRGGRCAEAVGVQNLHPGGICPAICRADAAGLHLLDGARRTDVLHGGGLRPWPTRGASRGWLARDHPALPVPHTVMGSGARIRAYRLLQGLSARIAAVLPMAPGGGQPPTDGPPPMASPPVAVRPRMLSRRTASPPPIRRPWVRPLAWCHSRGGVGAAGRR